MRRFSKLSLPSLTKYADIKYNFKYLKENLPFVLNNISNRGSSSNPERVVKLWEDYKRQLYDIELMRKRRNQHNDQ